MEEAGINSKIENHGQQTSIVTRIMTALWPKHVHTVELEIDKSKTLIITAEPQFPGNPAEPHPSQDHLVHIAQFYELEDKYDSDNETRLTSFIHSLKASSQAFQYY